MGYLVSKPTNSSNQPPTSIHQCTGYHEAQILQGTGNSGAVAMPKRAGTCRFCRNRVRW
jgi:hypothetical protein